MGQIQGKVLNGYLYGLSRNPMPQNPLGIKIPKYAATVKIIFRKAGVNNSQVSPAVLAITSIYQFMAGH